jgi:hydroxybutyrate-dimer hydrolase
VGGPEGDRVSISPSTLRADQNIDGALCLRSLALGRDAVTGHALGREMEELSERVRDGVRAVRAQRGSRRHSHADRHRPFRRDTAAQSRLSRLLRAQPAGRGPAQQRALREVKNAHHLDAFNAFAGFNNTLIPLHRISYRRWI